MDWSSRISAFLSDDRLLANLIGVHVVLCVLLLVSFLARVLLQQGGNRAARFVPGLRDVTEEATGQVRNFVYWITLFAMGLTILSALVYHVAGRDARRDGMELWNHHLTAGQLIGAGWTLAVLAGLIVGVWLASRSIRLLRTRLEPAVLAMLPPALTQNPPREQSQGPDNPSTAASEASEASEISEAREASEAGDRSIHEVTVRRWFTTLERFGITFVAFGGLWIAARVASVDAIENFVQFALPVLGTLLVARLLSLAAKALSHGLAALGDRQLGESPYRRYWERVTRLFPFGEKCFESVVYVWAASTLLRELGWRLPIVEEKSDPIIACIGIFFITRVLIELSHVILHETFGAPSDEDVPSINQKSQTLVPLMQSFIQYAFYFGSALLMLEVMKGPTNTILAGAGLLGLAVGLGAQSLVSDVVSGFFILFENQYLVGDIVQIGDANGRVEAVSIRHTQIRDEHGKVYIIPNGQIKSVINFSKGFVNAVVDIKAPTSMSVDQVARDLSEAGKRLRSSRREVLADTVVKGLVELSQGEMTVRAVTKVMPGTHQAMQNEFRRLLKEVMDQRHMKAAA